MIDLVVMGVAFTLTQYLGFAVLFAFYGGQAFNFLLQQRKSIQSRRELDEKFVAV